MCVCVWVGGGESAHLGLQRDAPHSSVLTTVGSDCTPGNSTLALVQLTQVMCE